jgi:Restriction endonuclease
LKKPNPTRTTGPLHFEDLEPHRFEDLVRRLIYDFRLWRQLEATGRSGGDEGYDIRGFEIVTSGSAAPAESDEDESVEDLPDRVWLIQCKREKSITPKKLGEYLDAIPADEPSGLYGIVFAAACDFSKKARDLFRARTAELGFAEAQLCGKGELEDMLYQPKNDDVLFTFFGISRLIRQRSLSTEVRRRLVVKRKLQRLLEPHGGAGPEVLVRDAGDDRYPYPDEGEKDKTRARRWSLYRLERCRHDGLSGFVISRLLF